MFVLRVDGQAVALLVACPFGIEGIGGGHLALVIYLGHEGE